MSVRDVTRKRHHKSAIREENEKAILAAAEAVFAAFGYSGASTGRIAARAGLPKANLHYYFPTKESLYRRVIENIFTIWLEAAESFDDCADPVTALTQYIHTKMDIARAHPLGSKVWANEIIQGAPMIQDYLERPLKDWTASRIAIIERWIADGRMADVDPAYLLYMIWATTQHYADFDHQVTTLNGGERLSDARFAQAKKTVTDIILRGIGAKL